MHNPRGDSYFIVIIDQGDILPGGRPAVIINRDEMNIHALRVKNHASREIMHRRKSCIAEK